MKNYNLIQQKYIAGTYVNRGITLVEGKGVYLQDTEGTTYLDMMSNYGVSIFGHHHQAITKALTDQLARLTTLHGSFVNDLRTVSAQKLIAACGGGLKQVYFANSGAEAIEAALKFTVLFTGKKRFIACLNGYHGKTLGALSATGEEKYRLAYKPLLWQFNHIKYNDVKALETAITPETAAFIIEPIQGEGGICLPSQHYLTKVRQLCDKYQVLLIIDEIQTGCGRTGKFLASAESGINYDIVCLGKGIAGGIPIGLTLLSEKVASSLYKGAHSSTFGGNPLASAAIIATLNLLNKDCLNNIKIIGNYFIEQLQTIRSPLIEEVRGKGLMIGVEVRDKRNEILKKLQTEYKILAIPAAENVVRFLPPYIIEKKHIDITVKALSAILKNL